MPANQNFAPLEVLFVFFLRATEHFDFSLNLYRNLDDLLFEKVRSLKWKCRDFHSFLTEYSRFQNVHCTITWLPTLFSLLFLERWQETD